MQTPAPTTAAPRLITVTQAAQLAGIHANSLRKLLSRAQDPAGDPDLAACVVHLPGSHLRIRRAAFERWLDAEAG